MCTCQESQVGLDLPSHFLKGLSVVMWFLNDIRTYVLLGLSDVRTDKPLIYFSFSIQKN